MTVYSLEPNLLNAIDLNQVLVWSNYVCASIQDRLII